MIQCAESHFTKDHTAEVLDLLSPDGDRVLIHRERAAEIVPLLHWQRRDVAPFVPDKQAPDFVLHAFVNDGRWVVQCPCGGAQLASRNDPRFFCVDCLNEHVGRRWIRVVWPKERDEIEAALVKRPFPKNRNWLVGEPVAVLHVENQVHEIA